MDDELKTLLKHLTVKVEAVHTDVTGIKTDVAGLKTDVAGLKTDVAALKVGQDEIRAELEQLRTTTSANHFRLSGRIDQVANMLADHMAQHDHGPETGSRRRA